MLHKVVGLTGGIGSGKSVVANMFSEFGVDVIDVDIISRRLTESNDEAISSIRKNFGGNFFLSDGSLNRSLLREKIFLDRRAKNKLEAILHPLILDESLRMLDQVTSSYALLVVPLLFETKIFLPLIYRSLLVDCDELNQVFRIISRDSINKELASLMISSQYSRSERLAYANDVIVNNGDLISLNAQVKFFHQRYLLEFC